MKRNYKSIKTLANKCEQITLENILHCRAYHKNHGWIDINNLMSDELVDEIAHLLGGNRDTKARIRSVLSYAGSSLNHWGLRRILYSPKTDRFSYCAGQDYPYELRQIRNYLK